MDTAQELEAFAKEKLRTILKDSGHVLYSSAETLCPGKIYLLGHNPGGSPEGREDESIENSLHNLAEKKTNEYLDDSWNHLAPGEAVLQKRVRWLLEQLNMDVREVCASNLIFSRSVDAKSSNFKDMANLCWPVHEYILRTVKPKMILAFGNSKESPFFFLQEKLGVDDDKIIPPHGSGHGSGDGEWKCKAFNTPNGMVIVGLPHLSRYAIDHHEDVPRWIQTIFSDAVLNNNKKYLDAISSTKKRKSEKNEERLLYCSFCGKSQHETRKLIAGPSVFICDECVDLCNEIIEEEGLGKENTLIKKIKKLIKLTKKNIKGKFSYLFDIIFFCSGGYLFIYSVSSIEDRITMGFGAALIILGFLIRERRIRKRKKSYQNFLDDL